MLSPKTYNAKTGLAVMVPITSQAKGYPFEVAIQIQSVQRVALADHLKNLNWKARGIRFAGTVPPSVLDEIHGKVAALLGRRAFQRAAGHRFGLTEMRA